jgi:hypothetical protein
MTPSSDNHADADTVALTAAFALLERWGCTRGQALAILGLPDNGHTALPANPHLDEEQKERIGYIQSIQASLRSTFNNPANLYGFMAMKNGNPPFYGRSPLEVISCGNVENLRLVCQHVRHLL